MGVVSCCLPKATELVCQWLDKNAVKAEIMFLFNLEVTPKSVQRTLSQLCGVDLGQFNWPADCADPPHGERSLRLVKLEETS